MIGSMIVGFLIGLIASAISNRGERMGLALLLGNFFLEIGDRCYQAPLLFLQY